MKPKYKDIMRKALPVLIILPGMASAAIINPDGFGNVHVTTIDSGPHNIQTGFFPVPGAHTILVDSGATINPGGGDAVEVQVFDASLATYTINNNGTLSAVGGAPGQHGIDTIDIGGATPSIIVNNTGTISGFSAIRANDTLTLVNDGTITGIGFSDGAVFAKNGASIDNNVGGIITGNVHGIQSQLVTGTLDINNYGSITGSNFDGITSPGIVTLDNYGTVSGNVNGVIGQGNGSSVYNDASIIGNTGFGVQLGDNANVTNTVSGTISGGSTGVWLDDFATVTNNGTISGTTSGVRVSDDSTITNNLLGTITGNMGIDAFAGGGSTFTLNNTGFITGTGGTAIDGVLGADTLNLNPGSVITGDIILNSGADNVNMTSNLSWSNIVNGDINGGTGTDVLTFSGGKTSPGSTTNIVHGDVTFMQDIIKNGSGTAFIGDVGGPLRTVQTDAIHVNSGGLYINGNVDGALTGQTTITNASGQLGGTGTWDANITLSGTSIISPGQTALGIAANPTQSVGTLTVTGDVTLGPVATYEWNAIPGGASDLIRLTGVGNQFNTNVTYFSLAPTDVNTPLLNGSTIVVDTQDTLIGSFDSNIQLSSFTSNTPDFGPFYATEINPIIAGYFTTLTKVNGNQDWQLTIAHDYSQFGSTPNEVAAGNMLDGLVNTATGSVADLLAALDYSDAQTTEDTLAALDPGSFLASAAGLVSNNYRLHRTVENHNAAVRADSGSVSMSAGPSAKGAVAAPVASGCAGTSNVWGSFSYDWQDLSTGNSAYDQDGETAAFTAGIDFTVAENLRLGLVAEGAQTSWDGNGSLGSDIDSYRLAAYANWGAATGWYVDALLGYNSNSVDQSRLVRMGNNLGIQSGGYDADGWQGMITVGNTIATSAGMFSPFIGLEWQQLDADSFTANGSALPIGVSSFDIDSIRGLIGVKWEADVAQSLKAYASLAYAYEFQGDAPTTTVSFGGGSYRAIGQDLGDSVLLSAGMRWNVADCTTVDFGYRGEFAMDDGLDSHGANIGVNYSF